jgi:hypothetical protein
MTTNCVKIFFRARLPKYSKHMLCLALLYITQKEVIILQLLVHSLSADVMEKNIRLFVFDIEINIHKH